MFFAKPLQRSNLCASHRQRRWLTHGELTPLADRESAAVHECTADASEGQKEVETHETEVTPNESLRSL